MAVGVLAGGAVAVAEKDPVATVDADGVVATLAGPGHCPRAVSPIGGSRATRAVAVDTEGRVFYETGPAEQPVIAVVDPAGEVDTLVSGIPQPPTPSGAPQATRQTPAAAGRIAGDGDGGVFLAAGTQIVHVAEDNSRTTVAGDPTAELGAVGSQRSGDGGPAADARFRSATSLARDAAGNLYVADHGGPTLATSTIRFVNRSEEPVTFYRDTPAEVTVEPGHIDTLAGADPPADTDTDDGEPTADEELRSPQSAIFRGNTTLAVDGDRLYVASAVDESDPQAQVELINVGGAPLTAHGHTVPPGRAATVAGGGDDPGTRLDSAAAIAVDGDNLFVVDPVRHRVHQLDAEGFLAAFAGAEGLGAEVGGFDGNRQLAVGARLNRPFDMAVGPEGQVYVSDGRNGQVRVVDAATDVVRAAPGSGIGLAWRCHEQDAADDGRLAHQVGAPTSAAVTTDGAAYLTLTEGHQVKRRDPSGSMSTVAGTGGPGCDLGCAGFSGDGGPAVDAELDFPTAVALGPDEEVLYVYDGGNARVRAVNLTDEPATVHGVTIAGGAIDTVAGTDPADSREGGRARDAGLARIVMPERGLIALGEAAAAGLSYHRQLNLGGVAVDSQGHLFIAEPAHRDYDQRRQDEPVEPDGAVRHVTPEGTITTVAGADASGSATECCADPAGLAISPDDNVYIADLATSQVWLHNRRDEPAAAHGHTIAAGATDPVAGTGTSGFAGAGPALETPLLAPAGLALDAQGRLHIAELSPRGSFVRAVDASGALAVVAGTGQPGFNGDGLAPRLTRLNLPVDVALDPCGNLLVADAGNDRLRRVNLAGDCSPSSEPDPGADDSGTPTLLIGVLALAAAIGGATVGWRWRVTHR